MSYYGGTLRTESAELVKALVALEDASLVSRFIGQVLLRDVLADPGPSIATVCEQHGWTTFQKELETIARQTSKESLARNARLLEELCTARPRQKAGWLELCTSLAQEVVGGLEQVDREHSPSPWGNYSPERTLVLAALVHSLVATGQADLLSRVVNHILATLQWYPLHKVQLIALEQLSAWLRKNVTGPLPALSQWLRWCREQLESLTASEPQPPSDFSRDAPISCKCADCAQIRRFLADPLQKVHRFSAAAHRRDHVEQMAKAAGCDLDFQTERRGSPHTLVCTKNKASFEARLKKYHEDLKHLTMVREIEQAIGVEDSDEKKPRVTPRPPTSRKRPPRKKPE